MAIINKPTNPHKPATIALILKELTQTFDFNDISEEYLKLRIDTISSDVTVTKKLNRDRSSYVFRKCK